jgi:hypothetical protein
MIILKTLYLCSLKDDASWKVFSGLECVFKVEKVDRINYREEVAMGNIQKKRYD